MADSVKLLRRNVTSLTVSDRVSVGRTFFDGQKVEKSTRLFVSRYVLYMYCIVGTVIKMYSGTHAQIRWDIDDSLSIVNISELSKVDSNKVITANDFEGLAGCLEQGSSVQAAESHALLAEFSMSEEIESEAECGKKKSKKKKRGRVFRKKLGDLLEKSGGDSDDSDVEFERCKVIESKKDEEKKRKIEEQGDKGKNVGKKGKKEVEKKGKIEQVDKREKKTGKIRWILRSV